MTQALLRTHFSRYPKMEPADAVKLLYQNEFGCEHLLAGEAACAARIEEEREALCRQAECELVGESASAFVRIGNGLCRLELRATLALSATTLARMMRLTAEQHRGTRDSFLQKLSILTALAEAGEAPFSREALDVYLQAYARLDYPAVHHSEGYRAAYAPAYRVARALYGDALPLIGAIERELAQSDRALLVIDGDCGAGKTTLAVLIAGLYGASVVHMDDFFLPPELRTRERLSEPGGNLHRERFAEEALGGLEHGEGLAYRRFDCHTGGYQSQRLAATPVTIIEGSYSLHPAFDGAYARLRAIRARLTVGPDEQLRRIRERGDDAERFAQKWIPLEKSYFEAYHKTRDDEIVLESKREDAL